MKKFSNITGEKVGKEPIVDNTRIDERTLFKVKVLNLMEQFLSIQTYGPVDRYLRAGCIEISGKELFTEALLSMLDEKTIKEQAKLLESLKGNVKDWEAIDNKIDTLKISTSDYNTTYKVNQLLEKYGSDEGMLVSVVEEKSKKLGIEKLESYLESFNSVNSLKEETKLKISEIYKERISKLNK